MVYIGLNLLKMSMYFLRIWMSAGKRTKLKFFQEKVISKIYVDLIRTFCYFKKNFFVNLVPFPSTHPICPNVMVLAPKFYTSTSKRLKVQVDNNVIDISIKII